VLVFVLIRGGHARHAPRSKEASKEARFMARQRTIGTWAIIAGVALDNVSYPADPIKGRSDEIISGDLSVAVIFLSIGLILIGMFLPRAGTVPAFRSELPIGSQERVANV
jgi:hypothetical protein